LLSPLLYLAIVYWGIGFNNSVESFWLFYLAVMLVSQVAAGLGFMISTTVNNVASASAVANLITLPAILFGGLFVNDSTVFAFLGWIQYLSPIRYGFECLCIAQWKPTGHEEIYQVGLGFDGKLNYWRCIYALVVLAIIARIISIYVLKINVKKF